MNALGVFRGPTGGTAAGGAIGAMGAMGVIGRLGVLIFCTGIDGPVTGRCTRGRGAVPGSDAGMRGNAGVDPVDAAPGIEGCEFGGGFEPLAPPGGGRVSLTL